MQPALFLSIGLHIVILLMPLPDRSSSEPAPEPVLSPSPQVPLTRLPSPQPSASLTPSPKPSPAPSVIATPPVRVAPSPPLAARPATPPPPQRSPQPTPSPRSASPSPTPSPDPVPPPAIPFSDVPVLAGAQTGCYGMGVCHQLTDGTPFRSAGQNLESQFQSQGYTVQLRDDLEETGRKIYELTRSGETRFLNVFSINVGETIYLVTPQPISLQELEESETLKAELETLLNQQVGTRLADPSQLAAAADFYLNAAPRPEIVGNLRLLANSTPEQLLPNLSGQLQAQQFSLTAAGGYGGGLLYEVTRGAYTGYLNIIPTIDQSGTVVVLWMNLPT